MPILTGKLVRGTGSALVTTIRFWRPVPGDDGAGGVVSQDVFLVTTAEDGTFTTSITPGAWILTWPKGVGGHPVTRVNIGILASDTTVTLVDALERETQDVGIPTTRFTDIAAMLAADSASWTEARTMNSFGTDRIRSGWICLLKTDPSAAGFADNGDSVLETDDGLAYALREWVSA